MKIKSKQSPSIQCAASQSSIVHKSAIMILIRSCLFNLKSVIYSKHSEVIFFIQFVCKLLWMYLSIRWYNRREMGQSYENPSTDWVLLEAVHDNILIFIVGDDATGVKWTDIDKSLKLFASHTEFIRKVAAIHDAHWWCHCEKTLPILTHKSKC